MGTQLQSTQNKMKLVIVLFSLASLACILAFPQRSRHYINLQKQLERDIQAYKQKTAALDEYAPYTADQRGHVYEAAAAAAAEINFDPSVADHCPSCYKHFETAVNAAAYERGRDVAQQHWNNLQSRTDPY